MPGRWSKRFKPTATQDWWHTQRSFHGRARGGAARGLWQVKSSSVPPPLASQAILYRDPTGLVRCMWCGRKATASNHAVCFEEYISFRKRRHFGSAITWRTGVL